MRENISETLKLLEKNGAMLLDCGCGDGDLTMRAARIVEATEIYGLDIDSEAVKKARRRGINASKSDLNQRFPFEDGFFNVVFSHQVLEHLNNVDNFVKEVYRVLKPKGYAVISSENLASWHNIFSLLLGYQDFSSQGPSNEYRIGNPLSPYYKIRIPAKDVYLIHKKIFTYQSLKEIFEVHGFKVEKIKDLAIIHFLKCFPPYYHRWIQGMPTS
jgi:ubiquinone/menaquinone biosynthesis C-methylase UbiE